MEWVAACLEEGDVIVTLPEGPRDSEVAVAAMRNGDVIMVMNMPSPQRAEQAASFLRRMSKSLGVGGLMSTDSFNGGRTLVGVVGEDGVNGGLPSPASEALAKECALRVG